MGKGFNSRKPNYKDYRAFVEKILKTIERTNCNQQAVEKLLKANLDKLDDKFAQVLRNWATITLAKLKLEEAHHLAADINNFSNLIQEFSLLNQAISVEIAITGYKVTYEVFTRLAFPEEWAMTQLNLGIAYDKRRHGDRAENIEKAINYYHAALEEFTYNSSFRQEWTEIQIHLGNAYFSRLREERAKNIEEAINCYKNALQIRTREAFPKNWAEIQINLGAAYRIRIKGKKEENLEKAISCFSDALDIFGKALPKQWALKQWAMTQNSLGIAFFERVTGKREENLKQAICCYEAALKVHNPQDFRDQWAILQNNLGAVYLYRMQEDQGDNVENLETAIGYLNAALEVRTYHSSPEQWAETELNLGGAYGCCIQEKKSENLQEAILCYKDALRVFTREIFPENYIKANFGLGLVYHKTKQFCNAYTAYTAAISTVESLRLEVVSGDGVKQKLAEEWHKLYQRLVEVCLEIAKDEPKYYNQAIEYVERSKARNLVELLANKDLYPKSNLYPNPKTYQNHCHQLDQLRREIPSKQRQLEILSSSWESEERYREEIEQRRQKLNHLKQQQDELLENINQIDSNFKFTQKVEPIHFSDIQTLIDERTAIIEWYITANQIITFIITSKNPGITVWTSTSEDLQALMSWKDEYLQDLTQNRPHWQKQLPERLKTLAEILHLEDILKLVSDTCSRLILIPHRYLHLFPLHALPLANGDFLCDRFPRGVGYAPSCQLLQLTQKRERPDFSNFFAVQNPTEDLLYTNLEVETISSSFPSAQVLVKQEATKTAVNASLDLPLAHCNHFSCHGEFNLTSPLESALILANKERLTLGEIFGLTLNQCRLVTLSACETGLTDPTSISDEYIGLPSGFLYAGSPSVVSSLWTVSDLSTAFLMIKFYENLRTYNSVVLALNQAQQWLRNLTTEEFEKLLDKYKPQIEQIFAQMPIKKERIKARRRLEVLKRQSYPFASPFYWAAFTATGL